MKIESDAQGMMKFNQIYQWLTNDLRPFLGEISQKYHLTYDQYILLKSIQDQNHVSGSELAAGQHVSRAAISRRCRELQLLGLIEGISRQEPDYRLTYFEVSKHGEEVLTKLNETYDKWVEMVNEKYGQDKFAKLVALADELVEQASVIKKRLA